LAVEQSGIPSIAARPGKLVPLDISPPPSGCMKVRAFPAIHLSPMSLIRASSGREKSVKSGNCRFPLFSSRYKFLE
jgi:hypothetical protein